MARRTIIDLGGSSVYPASYLADASSPRDFITNTDPVSLTNTPPNVGPAVGDRWYDLNAGSPVVPTHPYKPFIGTTIDHWAANETACGTMTTVKGYNSTFPSPFTWPKSLAISTITSSIDQRVQNNMTIKPPFASVLNGSMDQSFIDFIATIPVRWMTDAYGRQRPGTLIQYWGEAKHEALDIGQWQTGAKRWGAILKTLNRRDVWFGVCLQDFQFLQMTNGPAPNISQYYDPDFASVPVLGAGPCLDFVAVDVYSDWPGGGPSSAGNFVKQHASIGAHTQFITDWFKTNWPGIQIYTAELGIGDPPDPINDTPTKPDVMWAFYNALIASGISEGVSYFDRTNDPLKVTPADTAAWAAILADSKTAN